MKIVTQRDPARRGRKTHVPPALPAGQESTTGKEAIFIRIDAKALAYFRAQGPGYQARINQALVGLARSAGKDHGQLK